MSVHVITWVLKHSEARLGDRLVLLVLADHANADGSGAWPSLATIAREARISERAVRYSLRRLEAAGEVRRTGKSRTGTNVYTVITDRGAAIAGGQSTTPNVSDFAPEPSFEPSNTSLTSYVAKGRREGEVEFNPRNLIPFRQVPAV